MSSSRVIERQVTKVWRTEFELKECVVVEMLLKSVGYHQDTCYEKLKFAIEISSLTERSSCKIYSSSKVKEIACLHVAHASANGRRGEPVRETELVVRDQWECGRAFVL